MRQRTRELAKVGIFGSVDNPQVVTERDLQEIAETFAEVGKAPVSLNGHWLDPSRPRLGNVVAVKYDGATKTLIGTIEEQEELAEAVDKGYFPDVSIGAKRRAVDGKMYLHHVAYLGEEPPAIKDLVNNIKQGLTASSEGLAAADIAGVVSLPSVKTIRLVLSDSSAGAEASQRQGREGMTLEQALGELEAERKKTATLFQEAQSLRERLERVERTFPEALELSDADPQKMALVGQLRASKREELRKAAEGKVPKGKEPVLLALADRMPLGAKIELSEGESKRSVGWIDLLKELLEAIPRPVQEGRMQLSDSVQNEKPLDIRRLLNHV